MSISTLQSKLPVKLVPGKPVQRILEQGRDLRHAGLGAVAVLSRSRDVLIQESSAVFNGLVKEGKKRRPGNGRKSSVRRISPVQRLAESVNESLERVEQSVESTLESKVAQVMKRLDVPTSDDINKLSARVRRLSEQVENL